MGIRSILLTGDSRATADTVAARVGITQLEAESLSDGKLARIRELVQNGHIVAMLGHGLNDAPALAEANVGVAIGSGVDATREIGDVLLLGNDLAKFTETLQISRWTRRIIWQSFCSTIAVDIAGISLAAAGILKAWQRSYMWLQR